MWQVPQERRFSPGRMTVWTITQLHTKDPCSPRFNPLPNSIKPTDQHTPLDKTLPPQATSWLRLPLLIPISACTQKPTFWWRTAITRAREMWQEAREQHARSVATLAAPTETPVRWRFKVSQVLCHLSAVRLGFPSRWANDECDLLCLSSCDEALFA